jgi:hypothetical protein
MSKTTTLLATLLVALAPATSSAFSAPETRVRGIDLGAETRVGASSLRTPGSHLGISLLGCELASDRTYAASNPLVYTDPSGLFVFGFGLQWTGYFAGVGVNVSTGLYFGWDEGGGRSWGWISGIGGGAYANVLPPAFVPGTGAEVGVFVKFSTANRVCEMKGVVFYGGASGGEPYGGGADVEVNLSGHHPLSHGALELGANYGVGATPVEFHAGVQWYGGYDSDTGWFGGTFGK